MRALPLLLLAACNPDYNLNPKTDEGGGTDSDPVVTDSRDTDEPVVVDACSSPEEPPAVSVPENTECEVELQTGKFTPVVEWKWGNGAFCGPAAAGQIVDSNGSGAIDDADLPALLLYQAQQVIALKGDGSGIYWSSTTGAFGQDGGFAVGDVNLDGWPDVVTASAGQVCALHGRDGTTIWCTGGLSANLDPYGYSYPSIADMDGDGIPEVTAGNAILRGPTGSVRGKGTKGKGAAPYGGSPSGGTYGAMSAPVDLDGDGQLELVTGNAAYTADGALKWANSGLDGLVAVADFDGDGQGEIVKTTGIYVYGMETDGTEVWGPRTYSGNLGAPAIDDLDGDGTPEIVFAAQNALIAMDWGGTEVWRASISDSSGAAGPVLFDFELDGYPEVLYADETTIRFFSGLDGSVKFTSGSHASYTILETPIVADVDNDEQVEIILGHCQGNASIGAITVYGDADQTWPPGRKTWNQHAYQITNVDDLGLVVGAPGSNFSLYNSFRSGDVGRPPSEYWDLRAEVLDVCEDECDSGGKVYVAARMLNAGNIEAPSGVPISLRAGAGGTVIASALTTQVIPAGTSGEMVVFEVAVADIQGTVPVVTADEYSAGIGALYECNEGNNTESWSGAVCN